MTDKVELLKRLDPEHYFEEFLSEGVYPDGRQLTQFRDAIIDCGGSTGGYQVSIHFERKIPIWILLFRVRPMCNMGAHMFLAVFN
jgi:hypothetical protein